MLQDDVLYDFNQLPVDEVGNGASDRGRAGEDQKN
jgi:hypothetical protein